MDGLKKKDRRTKKRDLVKGWRETKENEEDGVSQGTCWEMDTI
jgi:hypothetical protein